MTSRRKGKFRCVACGRITVQPIDEDDPGHEIRSWCCGCAFERAWFNNMDGVSSRSAEPKETT